MQEQTNIVAEHSARLVLNIHSGKSKLEVVEHFTYLGCVVDTLGGIEAYVKARIGRAGVAFLPLKNIWKSKVLSWKTKMRISNPNVRDVLLYRAETWKTTRTLTTKRKRTVVVNSCLIRVLGLWWPETRSNERLWQHPCQIPFEY